MKFVNDLTVLSLLSVLFVSSVHLARIELGKPIFFRTVRNFYPSIVNGQNAADNEALFQVQVRQGFFIGETFCGGSLVGPKTVVTAAHCINGLLQWFNLHVRYGTHQLSSSSYPDIYAKSVHVHSQYDESRLLNDIAVIKLRDSITPSSNVQFVELQTKKLDPLTKVTIYGWGKTEGDSDDQPENLQKAQLTTLRDSDCNARLETSGLSANVNVICAVSSNQIACNGDSGGPMISPDGKLAGIASAVENGCPPGGLNIYTKVSNYVDFIKDHM